MPFHLSLYYSVTIDSYDSDIRKLYLPSDRLGFGIDRMPFVRRCTVGR